MRMPLGRASPHMRTLHRRVSSVVFFPVFGLRLCSPSTQEVSLHLTRSLHSTKPTAAYVPRFHRTMCSLTTTFPRIIGLTGSACELLNVRRPRVIPEHEVIEQIEDEPSGRALQWVLDFLASLERPDPWLTVERMWEAGSISLHESSGGSIPRHRCESVFRARETRDDVRVRVTNTGSYRIHGNS